VVRIEDTVELLNLKILNKGRSFKVKTGFTCDLLSVVMAKASKDSVWITVQRHLNTVAVATLREIGAIVISHGFIPDEEVIDRAKKERIWILTTEEPSFEISGKLYRLLRNETNS